MPEFALLARARCDIGTAPATTASWLHTDCRPGRTRTGNWITWSRSESAEANLWPEPRRSLEPQWSAEVKDRLESKLHNLICSGQLDVVEAQRAISEDWVEAYGRFFRQPGNFFPPGAGAMTPR